MRHSWTDKAKHYGGESATCARCGIIRDRRHAYSHHWTEYKRPGGEWFIPEKTPACEPVNELTEHRS